MMIDLTDTTTRGILDALTMARDQLGGPPPAWCST